MQKTLQNITCIGPSGENALPNIDELYKNITPRSHTKVKPRKSRRGRKPGDGAYDDAEPLELMKKLIETKEANNKNEAAWMVTKMLKIRGTTDDSIVRRLNRKFKE